MFFFCFFLSFSFELKCFSLSVFFVVLIFWFCFLVCLVLSDA